MSGNATIVREGFDTPRFTGSYYLQEPGSPHIERVSNDDASWIEEYQTENFIPKPDLGWARPGQIDKMAATRVAMRFRRRRAARE